MVKIFIASFNRASDGAISLLREKMRDEDMETSSPSKADYILAVGDRKETFDFVLKQYRKNKKIIHLWAGEISQGTHDEVYRHAMTLMSCMQLCTNDRAVHRVVELCRAVDKKWNPYTVGNVMLDNMELDLSEVLKGPYDLVLYNPPTTYKKLEILNELEDIQSMLYKNYIWIEPNGDYGSDIVNNYITHKTLQREKFLGLIKHCDRFITNSSCAYYEAPFLIDKEKIIIIGERNKERESKYANMSIKNASENIMKIFRSLDG